MERTPIQRALANGQYKRVADEVAEIRDVARLLAQDGDAFHRATGEFLTVQVRLLDSENRAGHQRREGQDAGGLAIVALQALRRADPSDLAWSNTLFAVLASPAA